MNSIYAFVYSFENYFLKETQMELRYRNSNINFILNRCSVAKFNNDICWHKYVGKNYFKVECSLFLTIWTLATYLGGIMMSRKIVSKYVRLSNEFVRQIKKKWKIRFKFNFLYFLMFYKWFFKEKTDGATICVWMNKIHSILCRSLVEKL